MTQFEIPKLKEVYNHWDNYEILQLNPESNLCVIYFSSHNIYYPNTKEIFEEQIINRNRFEWKKNILTSANCVIFLRDIQKQWYLEGINSQINTITKLSSFLKEKTTNLEVVCIGSSAGGYAATLIGCLLKVSRVFCFSGQFSLLDRLEDENSEIENPILFKYKDNLSYLQYYSLIPFIQSSSFPIFYFYPDQCKHDLIQSQLVNNFNNVFSFAFDIEQHGVPCYPINLIDLFKMDSNQLITLHQNYQGSLIQPFNFSRVVSGLFKTSQFLIQQRLKRFKAN